MDIDNLPEVTSNKLFVDKLLTKPDAAGLLSEQIFGPLYNYRCQCGAYNSKILHENDICPTCNVKCISSESRYTTWARVKLLFPIVKKQKIDTLLKIIKKKHKHLLDPLQADLTSTTNLYLIYDMYNDTIEVESQFVTGCIPLAITGVYSLYLGLFIISEYYNSSIAKTLLNCFTRNLLVVPPNCRMTLVADEKGNKKIFKSDLDELYSNLINIQNYNLEHYGDYVKDNQYYEMVKISLLNDLDSPIVDDQIRTLDSVASYFQYYSNKIYEKVSEILSGKSGLIRKDFLGKFLDFSSRSVTTVDPKLEAHQIRISKKSFMKLWYLEYLRFLRTDKGYSLDKVKYLVKRSEIEDFSKLEFVSEFIQHTLNNAPVEDRLIIMNRVPSLWRFSIPIVEIIGINDADVITVSPMIIEAMNMDKTMSI